MILIQSDTLPLDMVYILTNDHNDVSNDSLGLLSNVGLRLLSNAPSM